jgi:uncharacterized protein YkwD
MRAAQKRSVILLLVVAAVLLLLVSTLADVGTASRAPLELTPAYLPFVIKPSSSIPPDDLENEQTVADLINQHRDENGGLAPLPLVSELTQSARRHSRDMADNNFTSHTGSDGSDAGQRMEEAGYDWIMWGEIIAWGFGGNPESAVNWWMNSPGHRAIILDDGYEDFGVGYARNQNSDWIHYWTVNFGKRATYGMAPSPELHVCTFTIQNQVGGSSLMIYGSEPCQ